MNTFAKSAAVAVALVSIGFGLQFLNARATETTAGITANEIPSISPLEMMRSPGQLPSTAIDQYI